jgi:ribosomal protein L20
VDHAHQRGRPAARHVVLDRKILADIAVRDADTFRRFADRAREALAAG